ncbi:MAG: MFS transporter [Acidobacteriota bacterium]|nr:MFS transporter [Acidobacteriota bacterium]
MSLRDFRKAGHPPTLLSAFLYFDISFMVWVILGPLGPFIGDAYHLTAAQKGLLTAVPPLGGAFFRLILGWMTERFGGRTTGLTGLAATLLPLVIAWKFADGFTGFLATGLLLGVAGASFAAALPLASGWYPPEHQGLAMGIAGAGNSGTIFATLFAPRLAQAFGWRNVFGIAIVPVAIVWIVFYFLAKDAPGTRRVKSWSDYASILKIADTGWFCFIYSLTFGGFVGLVSYLSIFFHDQYHLSKVQSGDFTSFVVIFGSFLRPVGGIMADRIGGHRMLLGLLTGVGICLGAAGTLPSAYVALGILAAGMGMLGLGNGAVFQLLPQRFPDRVGIMTGIVGAAGGAGGFLLPSLLGSVKGATGSFGIGFAILSALMFTGALALLYLRGEWRKNWPLDAAVRAGLLSGNTVEGINPDASPA